MFGKKSVGIYNYVRAMLQALQAQFLLGRPRVSLQARLPTRLQPPSPATDPPSASRSSRRSWASSISLRPWTTSWLN